MWQYLIGFKSKLRIVITLTLVVFTVLSAISFNALQILGGTSKRVHSNSHNVNLLKDLQINVLKLSEQTNAEALQQLLPQYGAHLDQLAQQSPPQQAETIATIHQSLENWINARMQLLAERQRIGLDVDNGLRGEIGSKLHSLEEDLFSNFLKSYNDVKQNLDAFIEQQGEKQYQQVLKALDTFNQLEALDEVHKSA